MICEGMPSQLPSYPPVDPTVSRAPARPVQLNSADRQLAVKNALRYFPTTWHSKLAPEFADELAQFGHIYMHRFRPHDKIYARPIKEYPARCDAAAAIMLMIQNNLDPAVAQYPYELVTYGGNGAVFQNWAQYRLTMQYLSQMTAEQTLVLYSGHPLGLFPSSTGAPRVVVTNGMMIPQFSTPEEFERLNALGVTSYGQMTAGSFMYIGPQGIVHGTTITLLNAGRRYLGLTGADGLRGKLFVSSGLGGMSGAQAKAAVIAGAVGVIAEINPHAVKKRHAQGWVDEVYEDLRALCSRIVAAQKAGQAVSLAYVGNVVDLWEYFAQHHIAVDLGSDQTSLHNPYAGGYYPAGLSFEAAQQQMVTQQAAFRAAVQQSLRCQVDAIGHLVQRGMAFWDYGNAFLLEASRAGAAVLRADGTFIYPSYVQDLMGPICFDYGFGPFRWVCTSGKASDLALTDQIAAQVLIKLAQSADEQIAQQLRDNIHWIQNAASNKLVVGSQARILYADAAGRCEIACAFNRAIATGQISAPIVLGRDHHDVSGTDSPYRETADIYDGSNRCADMAVHNVIGDACRGATWVSLHNGGGVGWGMVTNGGFGLVLDGSAEADRTARQMLTWDVLNGVSRRAWAGNTGAQFTVRAAQTANEQLQVTLPHAVDPELLKQFV